MPSIRERKEAKLAEGGTRRKQRTSQGSLQPVDTAKQSSKGPQTPARAVFLGNGGVCNTRTLTTQSTTQTVYYLFNPFEWLLY